MFVPPNKVGTMMRRLIENLNNALNEDLEGIDLHKLHAILRCYFERIQFSFLQDGNGRTCRINPNVVLCKYAGVVALLGEDETDRKGNLSIKRRSSSKMASHGEYATCVLCKAKTWLREMNKELAMR
ncbi:hypothetical protein HD806DRAFT_504906 [Xylariaceae sp. AK1471]|nr:hypothetical protein HD806DRAFT_504906 [Xylariaceae sp. AK1471]